MARFSMDTIRIYNPLEFDFKFLWDGYWNTVKAKSYKDVERYKAMHYFKKISQFLIGERQIQLGTELLHKREKRGQDKLLDKYFENREIWDKTPKLNDEALLSEIAQDVLIGLVEEYGKDLPPEQVNRVSPKPEMSNINEQVFKRFTNTRLDPATAPEAPVVKPLAKIKEEHEQAQSANQ